MAPWHWQICTLCLLKYQYWCISLQKASASGGPPATDPCCFLKFQTTTLGQSPMWGARCRKFVWGGDLSRWNSALSNVTWPKCNCINLHSTGSVEFGWATSKPITFLVADQSSPFFHQTWEGWSLISDHLLFWFLIFWSVQKIFRMKV